jgi:eukaryotic-like serine/threonine-protein kinase
VWPLADQDPDDTEELPSGHATASGLPPEWQREQLPEGTRLGRYRVRARIAAGGGGTVYTAECADAPERKVAIKVLLREKAASPMALMRFQREAEVVGLIHHPNIVPVLDSGSLPDGRPYIVMELVSIETLKSLLEQRGRLSPVEMLEVLEPIGSALAAAHAAGVIHRDLKASNISVGQAPGGGGRLVIRLLDFGIAKLVEADPSMPGLTAKGARLGTPYAMAPEQIRGDAVDQRADIYSLGVLMFHMLTGSYPFSGASPQEIENLHLAAAPPRPGQLAPVPPMLEVAVLRCMEKQPAARFPSIDALLADVRAAVTGAGPGDAAEARDAVAILVELRPGTAMDDAALAALDQAEQALGDEGFQLLLQTGTTVLGARALPQAPAGATEVRRQALQLARSLAGQTSTWARVCLHVGSALASGALLTGGAIADVGHWPLTTTIDGIEASGAATRDLI